MKPNNNVSRETLIDSNRRRCDVGLRRLSPTYKCFRISIAFFAWFATASALAQAPSTSSGQAYPEKPMRMIVPFSAGAGTDLLSRIIARKLGESWGQNMVVENRPGGGTIIGVAAAAKAPPDGYTLVMVTPSFIINGAKWVYVPTKGGQASVMTLATGEGDLMFMGMLQIIPHVKSGRLKLIAVSSEKREVNLPDTPTVGETAGLQGFVTGSYQGIMGPGKLPPEIVNKMNAEVRRILALPDIKEKLASQGTTQLSMSAAEMGKWISSEKDRWANVIKISGFKIE